MEVMKKIPTLYKKAIAGASTTGPRGHELVGFAEKARRDGLLALEPALEEIDDAFTKKGMQLVVDGTDPDLVREVLDAEIEAMDAAPPDGAELFKDAGGYAPTMGIIGTVMGLLHVMQHLNRPSRSARPSPAPSSPRSRASARPTSSSCPSPARLQGPLAPRSCTSATLSLEGILAIQAGDNPRVVAEKLMASCRPPSARPRGRQPPAPPTPPGRARGRPRSHGRRHGRRSMAPTRRPRRRRALASRPTRT